MENESQCSFVRFRNPDLLRSLIEKLGLNLTAFACQLRSASVYEGDRRKAARHEKTAEGIRVRYKPEDAVRRPRRVDYANVNVSKTTLERALEGSGRSKKTPGQHNIAQDEAYAIRAELEATAEEKELGLGKLTLGDIGASPTHAGQGAELKKKLRKAENPIDLLMTAVIGLVLQWLYEGA